jgi:hypothetical protein
MRLSPWRVSERSANALKRMSSIYKPAEFKVRFGSLSTPERSGAAPRSTKPFAARSKLNLKLEDGMALNHWIFCILLSFVSQIGLSQSDSPYIHRERPHPDRARTCPDGFENHVMGLNRIGTRHDQPIANQSVCSGFMITHAPMLRCFGPRIKIASSHLEPLQPDDDSTDPGRLLYRFPGVTEASFAGCQADRPVHKLERCSELLNEDCSCPNGVKISIARDENNNQRLDSGEELLHVRVACPRPSRRN